jgi:hypothetical protein
MRFRFSKLIWGTFLLLAATLIIFNQIGGFADIGVGSIIAAVLSLAVVVQCIASAHFAPLPIPIAVLYVIFQQPLELPYIKIWALILASVLASMGLAALLPKRHSRNEDEYVKSNRTNNRHSQIHTESGNYDDNPSISVNFGAIDRRLYADNLETVRLNCNFGALKVFLDQAKPCQSGAEAIINCSFGGIELFAPKHWRVIDKVNCALGGVSVNKTFTASTENAPTLTLTGSVSLGGIDVRYV